MVIKCDIIFVFKKKKLINKNGKWKIENDYFNKHTLNYFIIQNIINLVFYYYSCNFFNIYPKIFILFFEKLHCFIDLLEIFKNKI